jgi:hypothetical protein
VGAHFQLNNVPPGDVRLHFTATGVNASAMLAGVADQQHVQVTLSVSGSTATILADVRDLSDSSVEVEGAVAAVSGACPAVTFTVKGTNVTTGPMTTYSGGICSTITAGASVEVRGLMPSDKTLAAWSVKFDKGGNGK